MKEKDKTAASQKKTLVVRSQILKVGFLFCSTVVLLDLLVWYLGRKEYLAFFDIFLSWVMEGLIRLSGLHVVRDSNTIYLTNSTWIVANECTALFIMIIFVSLIVAYPSSLRQKGIGLLAGLPLIFVANVLRLYTMAWIDYLKPQYAEFFHDYMWQAVFIVMVIFMCLVWIDKVVNREKNIYFST